MIAVTKWRVTQANAMIFKENAARPDGCSALGQTKCLVHSPGEIIVLPYVAVNVLLESIRKVRDQQIGTGKGGRTLKHEGSTDEESTGSGLGQAFLILRPHLRIAFSHGRSRNF